MKDILVNYNYKVIIIYIPKIKNLVFVNITMNWMEKIWKFKVRVFPITIKKHFKEHIEFKI